MDARHPVRHACDATCEGMRCEAMRCGRVGKSLWSTRYVPNEWQERQRRRREMMLMGGGMRSPLEPCACMSEDETMYVSPCGPADWMPFSCIVPVCVCLVVVPMCWFPCSGSGLPNIVGGRLACALRLARSGMKISYHSHGLDTRKSTHTTVLD